MLDRDVARITVEELACASDTSWQTYMNTVVTAKVAGTIETEDDGISTIDAPVSHY